MFSQPCYTTTGSGVATLNSTNYGTSSISDLFEINHRLTFDLWHLKDAEHWPHELSPRLILPRTRFNEIRVSEQEAKTLYINILNSLNYYYSIETPTEQTYIQKGKTPKSANIDLSIYVYQPKDGIKKFKKRANIEFKANKPHKEYIRKDIEKLIREGILGGWIHTIEHISNDKYLNNLFADFIDAFDNCKNVKYLIDLNKDKEKIGKISIVFYFYSIREKWACMKHFYFDKFKYDNLEQEFMNYVKEFFKLDYKINTVKNSSTDATYYYVDVLDNNNWMTISQKQYHDQIYRK